MSRSASPKRETYAPVVEADPQAAENAKEALERRNKKKKSFVDTYSYEIAGGVFGVVVLVVIFFNFFSGSVDIYKTDINDEAYINSKNSEKLTFTVGPSILFKGYKLRDGKFLVNNQASNKDNLYRCNSGTKETIIPDRYNFREAYPSCASTIVSQGNCSSSYGIAVAGTISNRWCKTNQNDFPTLSAQRLIACDDTINQRCEGGFLTRALDLAKIYGLVTEECYPFSEELESGNKCAMAIKNCQKFKIADYCISQGEASVKQQVYNYGPVITLMPVFRDFLIYKDGVYQVYPKNVKYSSGHAVKIIGWDVIEGQSCWLIENSWGEDWGKDGIACVKIEAEELKIEQFTIAPSLKVDEELADADDSEGGEESETAIPITEEL